MKQFNSIRCSTKQWQWWALTTAWIIVAIFVVIGAVFDYHKIQIVHATVDCPGGSGDITISANTSWSQGDYSCSSLTVNTGATLTIAGNTTIALTKASGNGLYITGSSTITANGDTTAGAGVTFTVTSDVTIDSGSKISGDAHGFAAGQGPGAGGTSTGGGYGGMGAGANGGDTYGSAIAPVNLGSGGGSGGVGGGAVKLTIGGNLTNSGTISADGGSTYSGDGGSGGSVWINFTGGSSTWGGTSGAISAKGGADTGGFSGGGGGGRVAVTGYVTDSHTGTTTAYGGTGFPSTAPGTVFTKSTAQTNGSLMIDNNSVTATANKYAKTNVTPLTLDSLTVQNKGVFQIPASSTLTIATTGALGGNSTGTTLNSGTLVLTDTHTLSHNLIQRGTLSSSAALTIASGGTLTADAATTLGNTEVQSGGNITHSANSSAETYKVNLTVNNLTVDASGTINVNGLGYTSSGPGAGGTNSGGGYGGMGGDSAGGDTYGSATAPVNIGSNGGSSAYAAGGAVKITVGGNFANSGTISANGTDVYSGTTGSGGSVWINLTGGGTWSGNGNITATGGSVTGGFPGGGGGGRVAVTGFTTNTHSGATTAFAGTAASVGAAGTVYTKSTAQTYGTLTIDNNSATPGTSKYAKSNIASLTLDSLVVQNKGPFIIPLGSTLTIASSGTMAGNSTGTTLNNGTLAITDTLTLSHTLLQRGTLNTSSALTVASGGTLTVDVASTLGNVTVQSGGNINHTANTTAETYKMDLTVNNLTVNSGGTISTNGLGFAAANGTCPGSATAAGCYGGTAYGNSGDAYGSATAPNNLGSGGQLSPGGGAIKLTIAGDLSNSGTISSNATDSPSYFGGSGGSVWLNFTGGSSNWGGTSGTISAIGGLNAGGGGRIAVTGYVTDNHTGTTLANGNTANNGTAGTVYTKSSAQTYGTLTIDNASGTPPAGKYAKSGITNLTVDSLVIQNKGTFEIPSGSTLTVASGGSITHAANSTIHNAAGGTFVSTGVTSHTISGTFIGDGTTTFGDTTVASGGNITHTSNTSSETNKLVLTVNNLTLNSGGTINVDGLGYSTGNGTGAPSGGSGGGGYGGMANQASGTGGNTYGSATAPINLGSGGSGGAGGGAIKINVGGNLTNGGTISAVGSGSNYAGSGGSIWINFTASGTWAGTSGTINASGGGAGFVYVGGGGRIAVTGYASDTHTGTTKAYSGVQDGAPGTIFTKSTSQTNGTLTIDNNNVAPAAGMYAKSNVTPLTVDSLVVQNKGTYAVPSGSTLTVASTGAITEAANTTIWNAGTFTSTGVTHTVSGTFTSDGTTTFGTTTVASGGIINHSANTTAETYKMNLTATALTVASGGLIDVNGLGYTGGAAGANGNGDSTGKGGLGGASSSGGGAGYGASGGAGGGASAGSAGGTYGSAAAPVNIGSGGGGGASSAGGAGGGAIRITTTGDLTVAGTIRANGSNGVTGAYGGGGGSGGSVYLTVGGNFNCTSGTVTANGGNGQGSTTAGGGGGGGRIARNVTGTYTACTTITASGGTGVNAGNSTSVYVPPTAPTIGAASSISATGVTWNWTDQSSTETSFNLYNSSESLIANVPSTTTATTGTAYSYPEGSLTPNTSYTRHAHANDGSADGPASSNASATTLAAVPSAPTVSTPSTSTLKVIIGENGNPSGTQYAIYETTTGNYVQANGTLSGSAVWQDYTTWGGASGVTVTGLSINTAYTFEVKARNSLNTETGLSTGTTLYTSANIPGAPSVGSPSTNTLSVTIIPNSNPVATQFAIYETANSKYVQADGSLNTSAVWQTYAQWGGLLGQSVIGLSPNVTYTFEAKAKNGNNVETTLSSGGSGTTFAAVPNAPSLSSVTATGVTVTLDMGANPASTEAAIQETSTSKYVQADGSLNTGTVWQTKAGWGGGSGQAVIGLTPNTTYTFKVKARNSASTETTFSATASALTLAAVPGAPTVTPASSTTALLVIDPVANPASTEFAVYETTSAKYVQANGTLNTTAVWQTFASWGSSSGTTVTGLTPNTTYTFEVKARNSNNTETGFSSGTSIFTGVSTPGAPTVTAASNSSVLVIILPNGNPSDVTYLIQETTTNQYVQANGALGAGQIWQTYTTWGGGSGQSVTGLLANTIYTFKVKAKASDNSQSAYSATSSTVTFASVPAAPTISAVGAAGLTVTLSTSTDPAPTQFAIEDTASGKFVQANGTLGLSAVWQTYTNWHGASGQAVTGLSPNVHYTLAVQARNSLNVETALSSVSGTYTLANAPGAPTLTVNGASSITLAITSNSNPDTTEYDILEVGTNKYVQANGTLGDTVVWQTYSAWGGTAGQAISGLTPNTNYTMVNQAKNGDGVATDNSSSSTAATLAAAPGVPTVTASTTSLTVVIDPNGNPASTTFAIYEAITAKYVQANGTLGDTAVWQTDAAWGGSSGTGVTGLTSGTSYVWAVKAKNSAGVETALSPAAAPISLVVTPTPTSSPSPTSLPSATPTPTATTNGQGLENSSPGNQGNHNGETGNNQSNGNGVCQNPNLLGKLWDKLIGRRPECDVNQQIAPEPPPPPCLLFCGVNLAVSITPPGGSYNTPVTVTLAYTPTDHPAEIRYTVDGSDPTVYSPQYSEPVWVPVTTTIKAKAFGSESPLASAIYTIYNPAPTPSQENTSSSVTVTTLPPVPPANGIFTDVVTVTLEVPAKQPIHYTLDGTIPTSTSTIYTDPIILSKSVVLTAAVIATNGSPLVVTRKQLTIASQPALVLPTGLLSYPVVTPIVSAVGLVAAWTSGLLRFVFEWLWYLLRLLSLIPLLFHRRRGPCLIQGLVHRAGLGQAFPHVLITLHQGETNRAIGAVTTNQSGAFRFGVDPGSYSLKVFYPGQVVYQNMQVGTYHGEHIIVSLSEPKTPVYSIVLFPQPLKWWLTLGVGTRLISAWARTILIVAGVVLAAILFLHEMTLLHLIILALNLVSLGFLLLLLRWQRTAQFNQDQTSSSA